MLRLNTNVLRQQVNAEGVEPYTILRIEYLREWVSIPIPVSHPDIHGDILDILQHGVIVEDGACTDYIPSGSIRMVRLRK